MEILEQLSVKDRLVAILCSLGVTISVTGALLIGIFGEEIGPTGAMFIKIWMVDLGCAMCAVSSIIALFF